MILRRQWFTLLWALFILVFTTIPGNKIPKVPSFLEWLSPDKIVHLIAFGVLAYLILYGNRQQYFNRKIRSLDVIWAVAIASGYGIITELLQYYVVEGRSASIYDGLANVVGATGGGMAYYLQLNKNRDKTKTG